MMRPNDDHLWAEVAATFKSLGFCCRASAAVDWVLAAEREVVIAKNRSMLGHALLHELAHYYAVGLRPHETHCMTDWGLVDDTQDAHEMEVAADVVACSYFVAREWSMNTIFLQGDVVFCDPPFPSDVVEAAFFRYQRVVARERRPRARLFRVELHSHGDAEPVMMHVVRNAEQIALVGIGPCSDEEGSELHLTGYMVTALDAPIDPETRHFLSEVKWSRSRKASVILKDFAT